MADVHSQKTRSYNMSRIKAFDTKPELLVRHFLHSCGFRYKLHDKNLSGKPDIVLPKYRTIIFINGCFWHGHARCKYFKIPKTRTAWWEAKIRRNKLNDKRVKVILRKDGWKVIELWECRLKPEKMAVTFIRLFDMILNKQKV